MGVYFYYLFDGGGDEEGGGDALFDAEEDAVGCCNLKMNEVIDWVYCKVGER